MLTVKDIRKLSGLTQLQFSEKYRIPLQTLKQWESSEGSSSHRQCPPYVCLLLQESVSREIIDGMTAALDTLHHSKENAALVKAADEIWG